jgi:hypothetical protein
MNDFAFTVTIPEDRVAEFRQLLAEVAKDTSGLAERARTLGYHHERMMLQPRPDGGAQLIVYLELDEGVEPADLLHGLMTYESAFTRWWNPRYMSFLGGPPALSETVFAWNSDR